MISRKHTKRRTGATKRDDQTPAHDTTREVELLAIEEQFLAEQQAGLAPQLSTYLRRYPDYGAELAAFVARTFIPGDQMGMLLPINDGRAQPLEHGAALSSGTQRAVEEIFGSDARRALFEQLRVAEQRTTYVHDTPSTRLAGDADDHEQ